MAYEYDYDCPFEAFITNLGKYNEGELVGEWVKFPTTSEELQKVFERIGIGSKDDFGNPYEEWFISDYDCYVDGLYEKLGEYENLDELNYLASKLDELDDHDYNHFQAAMQISDYTGSIKDVINLIDNLDKYEIYPGVESNADLGHYYIEELGMMEVPDYLADYIDYEAYGRDVAINEMGQFTDYGYVRDTQEYFTEYYDGDRENIPDEYRVMDFKVSGEKERKTMNYETFKQEFAEDIKEKLYERGYDDVRISFNNVEKTNQNYEAMSVVPEGSNVRVNFNIENAFANYEHTDDYAGVLASATMVIADGLDRAPAIDVSALMDYENMKEKLSVEVISADANADLLANVPHDRMEDLAVVYRFVMESSEDGRASILVTNNLIRFRSLGEDFTEENLKKVIAGEKEPPEKIPERKEAKPEKRKFDLVVDIQKKMAQGKNGGYVQWAKKYNVKQFAESILFLQQHDIHDKETLDALVDGSSAKYHELMKTIKDAEEKMAANKVIKTHIINYAKTRETYSAYRKSGYSKKFYEAHRDEITLHKAAKEAFSKLPDGKIPKVKDLNEEFARLLSEKKAAYSEYKKIKKEMRDYQIAKQNVESFYAAQQSWDIEEDMRKKRQQER